MIYTPCIDGSTSFFKLYSPLPLPWPDWNINHRPCEEDDGWYEEEEEDQESPSDCNPPQCILCNAPIPFAALLHCFHSASFPFYIGDVLCKTCCPECNSSNHRPIAVSIHTNPFTKGSPESPRVAWQVFRNPLTQMDLEFIATFDAQILHSYSISLSL